MIIWKELNKPMAKLTKEQKRKKKLNAKKKAALTKNHQANRTNKLLESLPLGNPFELIVDPNIPYGDLYTLYKKSDGEARCKILENADQEYGGNFDPEVVLDMIVEELLDQHSKDIDFSEIINDLDLKWWQIQESVFNKGLEEHARMMTPLIEACGYELKPEPA